MSEIHQAGTPQAQGNNWIAKAGHAVDMAGDALSGFVFVDCELVGDLWGEALLMESAGKFFRPIGQFYQVYCLT